MKKLLLIAALLFAGYAYLGQPGPEIHGLEPGAVVRNAAGSDAIIAEAFANSISDLQVAGSGTVVKLLPDDDDGRRHQRFIIELVSGQTLLVAHNIDLAPRIDAIRVGDTVQFNGEYEWNDKGGVIHWTHHDPDGSHIAGWLKHQGRTYQ